MQRLVSLLLLLCLLVACGGPADDPDIDDIPTPPDASAVPATPAAEGQVTISFAAWEYEQQIYEPLIQQFTAENPNITVVLVPMEDLLNAEQSSTPDSPLNAVRRLVSGADTASSSFIPPEAFGTNLLFDLTPLMEADPNFSRDDFYPGALERVTTKSGIWALPRYLYIQVLSYNQELFKNANLAEPKAGWSWNDVLAAAEQLTQKNGSTVETYGILEPSGGMLALPSILKTQGIELLNTPPKAVQLDQPEVIAALERLRDLNKNGVLLRPQYREDKEPLDFQQLVRDGRVALWGDEFIGVKGDNGQPQTYDFPVGKVPYPVDDTGIFGITGPGDGFIISGGTAHPNEAWKWIEFLSRQQPNQGGPFGFGGVPARKSLAEQSGFWQGMDEATKAAYQAAIAQNAQASIRTPDYTVFGALSQALSQVIDGDQDPRKALQEAQQQMQDQIAQTELTPTPEPDTSPVIVATPEPQVAPEGATTINFGLIGYGTSEMRKLARAFRDQHPDIFVQIKATDVFTRAPEIQDLIGTSDCFTWWSAPQSDADFKGLLDLQPLLDSDAAFPRSDYGEALLEPYRHNGGLFGLPYAVNYRTLNFNRTIFDTAGIATPTYEWKPDDFLAAAQALTTGEGDKKQYGYVPLYGAQQDLFFFVGQLGARISTGSGSDVRPNFDDPKLAEAIQWYLDLSKKHKVTPVPTFPYKRDDPGGDEKSFELIQQGRAGMWFDQGYGMLNPNPGGPAGEAIARPIGPGGGQPPNFEVGLSPLPIGAQGLRSGDFFVRGFHISAQSQQPQACWEWLKFLSGDITNLQGSIPARASVGQSQDFINQASPETVEIAKIYAEALKRPGQPGDDMNALFSKMDTYWFFKAISEAVEDKTDLGEGLAAAQKLTNAYLDCIEQNPGKPATCATQVDPTYQGYSTEDPPEGGPRPLG